MANELYKVNTTSTTLYKAKSYFAGTLSLLFMDTYVEVDYLTGMWAHCIYNDMEGFIETATLDKVTGSITIKYIDENHLELSPSMTFNNLDLQEYTYPAIEIEDYIVSNYRTSTVILSKDNLHSTITFNYVKYIPPKGTVTIKYTDSYTNTPIAPQEIFEDLNFDSFTYECRDIDGYIPLSELPQSVTITPEDLNHEITFEYKKIRGYLTLKYKSIDNDNTSMPNTEEIFALDTETTNIEFLDL